MSEILLEFARVGKVDGYNVSIYSKEGPIPHFHFYDDEMKKKGCIRLDKAEYFVHGDNNHKLNSKEVKNLINWMLSKHRVLDITIWEYMCILWGDNNPEYLLPEDLVMPDYYQLKGV